MNRNTLILIILVVALIMFAPLVLAESVERFFNGLGTMLGSWSE